MLAITIVLFVVPHNQQIVTIRQFFIYRIPLFRNQNLNIQETMNMSKDAIYDQLTSEYGEKFTAEEAQYAIDNLDE